MSGFAAVSEWTVGLGPEPAAKHETIEVARMATMGVGTLGGSCGGEHSASGGACRTRVLPTDKGDGGFPTTFLFGRRDAAACPTAEGQEAEELAPCRAQCGCAALGRGACQAPPVSQATKGLHPDPPQTRGGHTGHTGNDVLPKL